jgi:hypothetical protein
MSGVLLTVVRLVAAMTWVIALTSIAPRHPKTFFVFAMATLFGMFIYLIMQNEVTDEHKERIGKLEERVKNLERGLG